jgi:hypothetical protein
LQRPAAKPGRQQRIFSLLTSSNYLNPYARTIGTSNL